MKRLVVFLLTAVLAFSLAGCRGKENVQSDDSAPSEEIQVQDETGETTETEPERVESNTLIAYFSLGVMRNILTILMPALLQVWYWMEKKWQVLPR